MSSGNLEELISFLKLHSRVLFITLLTEHRAMFITAERTKAKDRLERKYFRPYFAVWKPPKGDNKEEDNE